MGHAHQWLTAEQWWVIRGCLWACFLLEFVLRYGFLRKVYWWSIENIFDFLIIVISFTALLEEARQFQEEEDRDHFVKLSLWLQACRFIRIFRFTALMRIVWE